MEYIKVIKQIAGQSGHNMQSEKLVYKKLEMYVGKCILYKIIQLLATDFCLEQVFSQRNYLNDRFHTEK